MDDGRSVVAGVAPADGILHHGFAQKSLGVAPGHARVDGGFKVALNVHLLADLAEHAGHAGVLTNGQAGIPGGIQIVAQGFQCGFGDGPLFRFKGGAHRVFHIGGKPVVGLHAKAGHCFGDGLGTDLSHSRATPEARAACSTAEATASRTRGSKAAGMI